ncbi:arsenic resistance protein [Agrococcus sediminis]|uniref:Arsenic resistance protein n=1 Tax=Agrococcus sediminis TaxID=2599924 RepID=A0A5M8QJJ4_9MICO|nr:arsenic resistance protein [Agrococcus sediminis]KAA6435150.1 arsenic resistance protein [Agrococcus sediminis]RWR25386.1 arsenic resistance protein [Agrococcus lahaulensis]
MTLRFLRALDRHQVPLYIAAIAAGGGLGLLAPRAAPALERAIEPALMLLLFATFLCVPMTQLGRALRDVRFLATVLTANFALLPLLAWGLSLLVADDRGLLLGVLLVLLAPCVDYVVVFAGLAGGAGPRLLAATPFLMLVQVILLPVYIALFAGAELLGVIEPAPFVEAFVLLIAIPLAAAATVQSLARKHPAAGAITTAMADATPPLMMLALAVVVGSQVAAVGSQLQVLMRVVPLFVAFAGVAAALGVLVSRIARLDAAGERAVIFSLATRNSLVVLPLALALPPAMAIAPLAVVTQTLVELVVMVVLVRVVPQVTPARSA